MKNRILSFIIFALAFCEDSVQAQQQQQSPGKRIYQGRVIIFNNSHTSSRILLGDEDYGLDTFNLQPQEVWYSQQYLSKPKILIQTGNIFKSYTLKLSKTYMIFWRENEKFWDVKKIKNRQ